MNNLRNSVRLVGFIGKDPEVKTFESGKKKVRLLVATQEVYKNGQGERQTKTQWHNVVAWGQPAHIAEQYLQKGSQVAINGRLMYRSYEDANGETRYITEVLMNEIVMLDRIAKEKVAS